MTSLILGILAAVALLAAVIPFCRTEGWWVRGFDFPRLQFVALAATVLAASLLVLDLSEASSWAIVAAAFVALCIEVVWIIPYTPLWPKEAPSLGSARPAASISIVTANVLQPNDRFEAFLTIVGEADPDILVVLEADRRWQDRLDALERERGYKHTLKRPQDNLYGMLVYSKLPFENGKIQYLVEDDVPSMHVLVRLPSGHGVRMHFVHPAPPSPSENAESSERDAELLIVGKSAAKSRLPVIVTGDLNDVAWSATTRLFRKASGLRDPRIGRGMLNTFHARFWFLRWPLDHLFCSKHFQVEEIRRLPAFGSDHFPMLMRLAYVPDPRDEGDRLQADEEDEEWIEEKLEDESAHPNDVHCPER